MFRRFSMISSLFLAVPLFLTWPTWAQDEPQGEFQRPGRGERRGNRGEGRGRRFERMRQRFTEELDLDEEQQAVFEDIMSRQRDRWRERRDTFRQIRQAEDDGDTDLADELRASLGDEAERGNPMEAAFAELKGHLSEDQVQRLDEMRERFQQRGRERMDRLADRLELDEDQRAQLDDIGRSMRERMRARFRGGGRREGRSGPPETGDGPAADGGRPRRGFERFFDEVEGILREDQIPLLNEVREERQQRFARGGPGGPDGPGGERAQFGRRGDRRHGRAGGALRRLEESVDFSEGLDLDEQQRTTFDAAMRSARTGLKAGETNEKQAIEYVLEEMRGSLNPDQIEAFGEVRESLRKERARDRKVNDVRLLFMSIGAVELDPEQARAFRDIYKASAAEFKKVRKDPEARAKLAENTKKQIVELLSPRQVQRFERQLERARRRVEK